MRGLFTKLSRLVSGLARRLLGARAEPPARLRPSGAPRPRQSKKPPYDLEKDASTDDQKYLM